MRVNRPNNWKAVEDRLGRAKVETVVPIYNKYDGKHGVRKEHCVTISNKNVSLGVRLPVPTRESSLDSLDEDGISTDPNSLLIVPREVAKIAFSKLRSRKRRTFWTETEIIKFVEGLKKHGQQWTKIA